MELGGWLVDGKGWDVGVDSGGLVAVGAEGIGDGMVGFVGGFDGDG